MEPEDFLSLVWEEWAIEGRTLPLPELWRIKIKYVPATVDDWQFAVRKSVEATSRPYHPISNDAVFNYAVGIAWHRINERSDIDGSPLESYYLSAEAEMQAEADRIAAEVDREERRTAHLREYEERWARKREAQKAVMDGLHDRDDLVRVPVDPTYGGTPPRIHRNGGCKAIPLRAVSYRIASEDTAGDLCGNCFKRVYL